LVEESDGVCDPILLADERDFQRTAFQNQWQRHGDENEKEWNQH
jgi:hypothetical protein